jgi:hypothetical protein
VRLVGGFLFRRGQPDEPDATQTGTSLTYVHETILKLQNQTHPMSANLEQHDHRLCVLRVGGELKKSELDAAQSEFVQQIAATGTIKLLVLLENFTGWERTEAWGDTDFFFSHRNDFEKIAVVGQSRWEAQVLAFTGAGLRKGPVKFFPEPGESDARAWLAE